MSLLLRIARVPAVSVPPASSVQTAIDTMAASKSVAVVVTHQDIPVGIFTARDLVRRVMAARFPHDVIRISEVMTSDPKVVTSETGPREALSIMLQNHIRHLPIVDADHRLQGCSRRGICSAKCWSTFLRNWTRCRRTSLPMVLEAELPRPSRAKLWRSGTESPGRLSPGAYRTCS